MSAGTVVLDPHIHVDDAEYTDFLAAIRLPDAPLFTTDADGLFDLFLSYLPEDRRRHYTCNTCRHFVDRFGGLVTINDKGAIHSALWSFGAPEFFRPAVKALKMSVEEASVTGVFLTNKSIVGTPVTEGWHHMSAEVPRLALYHSWRFTPWQAMAEKVEDFGVLSRSLDEFGIETARTAVRIAESDLLYRAEKIKGVARWFLALHESIQSNKRNRSNLVWRAVATASAGYAHVHTTMLGTVLEDIKAGMSFDSVSKRFSEKMNPAQYQRPQVAPTAGNIAQAEKIVAQLGIENSLKRRYARLDEIQTLWKPRSGAGTAIGAGVFGHLSPKKKVSSHAMDLPAKIMTWVKFRSEVLPGAEKIEFMVPRHGDFCGMLTAADMDAPPIIQWDSESRRNPVSWYLYTNGSLSIHWGLSPNAWASVTGVCHKPSMWQEWFEHHGKGVLFILEGAQDNLHRGAGSFPGNPKKRVARSARNYRSALQYRESRRPRGWHGQWVHVQRWK